MRQNMSCHFCLKKIKIFKHDTCALLFIFSLMYNIARHDIISRVEAKKGCYDVTRDVE